MGKFPDGIAEFHEEDEKSTAARMNARVLQPRRDLVFVFRQNGFD